jgi:thiopeptide-type bacteriocin biosynthesis protein
MGMTVTTRIALLHQLRATYGGEAQFGRQAKTLRSELAGKYRLIRPEVEKLISSGISQHENLSECIQIIDHRSRILGKPISNLRENATAGKLTKSLESLAGSFIHMHVNRMIRSAHQRHEFALYDILFRVYTSQLARAPILDPTPHKGAGAVP